MKILKKFKLILLFCGILSTVLYVISDSICSIVYPGYSYTSQAISELSANGAPTTHLWKALTFLFDPLVIAFGMGVFLSSKKWTLKVNGMLLVLFGISGYAWWFFPMNMRGNIGSPSDTGHLVLSAITVLLLTLILAFGSGAMGKKFRVYSILTILVMLFFGFLVGRMAPLVAANQPTTWMGIYERISVFSPMIWMTVLAIIFIKKEKDKVILNK